MTQDSPTVPAKDPPCPGRVSCRVLRFAIIGLTVVALALAAVLLWALTPLGPSPEAMGTLEGSSWVTVARTPYGWRFQPQNTKPATGLVIYPGGRVDARSYAPLARDLAARGHLVAIVEVPLSLAVLSPNAADLPITQEPFVETWVLAGHSLGGVMAARYAATHQDTVAGLLLLASYADEKGDLSGSRLVAASLVGSLDGVVDRAAWKAASGYLPPGTAIVEIPGGNHSQFGSYGLQRGDKAATIPEDSQREQTVQAADGLLRQAAAAPAPQTDQPEP